MNDHRANTEREALLLEVRGPVKRFLRRLVPDPSVAEDVESETLLTLIQRLQAGLVIRRPVSFALQVAWSKTVEVQRRSARRAHLDAPRPTGTIDPARTAELRDWLEAGLATLEPVERALLHLRYVEDLSYRELARVLDEPIGTIGRRLHDARLALRRSLEKCGGGAVSESALAALLPMLRFLDGPQPTPPPAPLARWAGSATRFTLSQKLMLTIGAFIAVGAGTWLLTDSSRAGVESPRPARTDAAAAPRLVADATPPAPPPDEDAAAQVATAIGGRVVDDDGRGVAGATVRWTGSTGGKAAWSPASPGGADHVTTDGEGAFRIQPRADQTLVDLVASAPGFAAAIREGVRVGVADVALQLGSGLGMTGVVTGLDGRPISDATVTYHARVGDRVVTATVKSARDGRYAIRHMPVDPSRTRIDAGAIEVSARGHARQVKPVAMALPGDEPGSLELNVWLARGAVLEGTVRNESGAPIPDASVEVWMNSSLEIPSRPGFTVPPADPIEARRIGQAKTDHSGRYRIENVPVRVAGIEPGGRFQITRRDNPVLAGGLVVSAPGHAPAGAVIPLASDEDAIVNVDVALQRELVLTGVVLDEGGAPLEGVEVRAELETEDLFQWVTATYRIRGRGELAITTTAPGGGWGFEELPRAQAPGRIVISATSPRHVPARLVIDDAHESGERCTLVLHEARMIRGVVVDDRGAPVAGAAITLIEAPPVERTWRGVIARAAADIEGRFEITVPGGDGRLRLRADALGLASTWLPLPSGAEEEALRITMTRERVVQGTVISAEGRPVAGAVVTAVPGNLPAAHLTPQHLARNQGLAIAETTSDAAGAFALLGLPPDPVNFWAGIPWPRNDGLLGLLLGRKFAVVVPEPRNQGPLVINLDAYRVERGSLVVTAVAAGSGSPIMHELSGSLVADDGMIGGLGIFSGPGLLVFHGVPSGTYRLMIEAAAYPRVTKPGVTIGTHAHPAEMRVELGRGGRLVGRVRHDGPFPPGEIHVRGVPESKDAAPLRARCGADGAFDVDGLAPGGWRIWAEVQEPETPPSMTSRPHSLDLEVGKTAPPVELRLLPIQRATFRVSGLFPDGEPPTTDKSSPAYGDLVRRFGEFRLRCRDGADACWIDAGLDTFPYQIVDRDVIFHLPLPEGDYVLALDHGDEEIASRRLRSPGVAEAVVPAR